MQQVIHVWLEDKPGALMRVAGIITARGANIQTLVVAPDPAIKGTSRMTIVADVEPWQPERIIQQMNRLVQVLVAVDATKERLEPEMQEDDCEVLRARLA